PAFHRRGRRGHGGRQRVHPLHRRRRVRVRRRNRHLHAEAARARPDGVARAHHIQVRRVGRRPDPRLDHSLMAERFESVDDVTKRLRGADYLADAGISGVVFLADRLEKPVLVEGPAGVGKTELAKGIAAVTDARLIRLQCYEGLDEAKALYEWNYKKQLLRIQVDKGHDAEWEDVESDIFSEPFL